MQVRSFKNFRAYCAAILMSLLLPLPALAGHGDEEATVLVDDGGLAIYGYDTVAYFTQSDAVLGEEAHSYEWQGAKWQFSSAKHRALFIANPEKYAPQYGAFCALGVTYHKAVPVDPKAWTIVDDKLYLNYNVEYRDVWREDSIALIKEADGIWAEHNKE